MKKFVLRVEYGTGKASMLTGCPDLVGAINEFLKEYERALPDTKMYGLPAITKAELLPLMYKKEEK